MASKATTESTDTKVQSESDKALSAARTAAAKRLREEHTEEFNGYLQQEAAARGVDWTPRKTKEERDREMFQTLLAENPHLLSEISPDVLAQIQG